MKNVLVIAYYFPPSGGPGVQRVLKHIQYLPEFGWNPIVLTVSNGDYPARDESLLAKIPKNIHVERTHIYEPYDIYRKFVGLKAKTPIDVNTIKKDHAERSTQEKIAEFIRATLFIPDARIGWLATGISAGKRLIHEHSIEAIYSSSPPYTCSLLARALKRATGKRWIAGFRDPWTGFLSTPKRWFLPAAIDRHLERSVFSEADAVEVAWEGIIKDVNGKYPDLDFSKFHHVTNGFDSADFPDMTTEPPRQDTRFTLTYTGSMYGRRTPASVFAALEMLIAQGAVRPDELCLRFIGRFGNEVQEMFANATFSDSIEVISYVPHAESVRWLFRSDVLLLVVDEAKDSEEIVPGKVYEYIGTGKPVLAIAPQHSAIAELIRSTNAGFVAHQSEIEKTAELLRTMIHAHRTATPITAPNMQEIQRFERRESARELAKLLTGTP